MSRYRLYQKIIYLLPVSAIVCACAWSLSDAWGPRMLLFVGYMVAVVYILVRE